MGAARQLMWIQTYTGKRFYPAAPEQSDIEIADIAHALSLTCRFGGHIRSFYSVAQHSVHVSEIVPDYAALHGLLHDASEAYMTDLPTPVKRGLPGFREMEDRIQSAVLRRWGLAPELPLPVKHADQRLLVTEARDLFGRPPTWIDAHSVNPLRTRIVPWSPVEAEESFLLRFRELSEVGARS